MENFFYRVKNLDTLRSISKKFNIPTTVIIYDNNLTEEISEGDLLYLSRPCGTPYVVGVLDTLDSIESKFCVKREEILDKNKTPYLIYGEIIII